MSVMSSSPVCSRNPYTRGSFLHALVNEALTGEPMPQAEPWPDERVSLAVPEGAVLSLKVVPEGTDTAEAVKILVAALGGPTKSGSRLDCVKAELHGLDALRQIIDDRRQTVVQTINRITARRVPR